MSKSLSSHVLELDSIYKSFLIGSQTIEIIKGVGFSIQHGDFLILFGPSGCGKSTVLNIMLGLEPPTKGVVKFLDANLYAHTEDERAVIRKKEVGMVYQQSNWVKALSVIENVCFPLILRGVGVEERMQKALELLRVVGMEHAADQIPMELSAGQQQRISLARALVSDPTLLIADEPTGNLDSKAGEEIMGLFSEFNKKGRTVVMVTHDLEYLKYASRSVQMSDGLVVNHYSAGDDKLKQLSVSKRGGISL